MNDITTIEKRINQYLDAVRYQLSGLTQEEVDSIVEDLREQIDATMKSHGNQPTIKTVEAVLSEMDSPESFAQNYEATMEVVPKVSRLAIAGAVLLPFGILMGLLLFVQFSSASVDIIYGASSSGLPETTWWQWLLRLTVLPLGMLSPFATTTLGLMALSQIRASKGKLVGKPLALIDALFYPILVFDGLLLALLFGIISVIPNGYLPLTEALTLLTYIMIIIVDFIIVVIAWLKIR